jgi:hypothetical protein
MRYTVEKHQTRKGYTVRDARPGTKYYGGSTFGWYKLKRDAEQRAGVLNDNDYR